MHPRKTPKAPISIGDETAYGEAVSALIDAWENVPSSATSGPSEAQAFQLAEAAGYAAWDALTAYIDSYCARRVVEILKLR